MATARLSSRATRYAIKAKAELAATWASLATRDWLAKVETETWR